MLHNVANDEDEAREYKIQHEAEFKTDPLTINNQGTTIIGPFKENRERVDFYNKHTEVIRCMMKQLEADHKLAKDIMDKEMKNKKKQNIREMGPDAPGLSEYIGVNNTVRELGAKRALTKKEQKEYAEACAKERELLAVLEAPEDSICVDIFSTDPSGKMVVNTMYSQAEAPLFLEQNSEYADKYQPVRDENESLDTAYKEKTIVSKDGKKMTIRVPKKE
jgi:hypothetical protein